MNGNSRLRGIWWKVSQRVFTPGQMALNKQEEKAPTRFFQSGLICRTASDGPVAACNRRRLFSGASLKRALGFKSPPFRTVRQSHWNENCSAMGKKVGWCLCFCAPVSRNDLQCLCAHWKRTVQHTWGLCVIIPLFVKLHGSTVWIPAAKCVKKHVQSLGGCVCVWVCAFPKIKDGCRYCGGSYL